MPQAKDGGVSLLGGRGRAPPLQEYLNCARRGGALLRPYRSTQYTPTGAGTPRPKQDRGKPPHSALSAYRGFRPSVKNARRRWKTSAPGAFHVLHLRRLSAQPPAAVLDEPALHGGQLIPLAAPRLPAPVLPLENIFTLRHISCLLLIYNIVN